MDCRFCGAEMADGWVAVRETMSLGAADAALEWEPAEIRFMKRRWRDIGKRGVVTLLNGRFIGRQERAAALCPECGAVEIDPTSPVRRAPRKTHKARKTRKRSAAAPNVAGRQESKP